MNIVISLWLAAAGAAQVHVAAPVQQDQMKWVASEMTFEAHLPGPLVKGAPYSAGVVHEATQMLYDGNRIHRKTTGKIYRDSQGRTRQEQTVEALGPWVAADPVQSILISDPVGQVSYALNPKTRSARRMSLHRPGAVEQALHGVPGVSVPGGVPGGVGGGVGRGVAGGRAPAAAGGGVGRGVAGGRAPGAAGGGAPGGVSARRQPQQQALESHEQRVRASETKTESLGRRHLEGVEAEGTRSTMTIPAGGMGNERPLEIVTERWYSPELRVVVLSKRTDPMFGETLYRLVNIQRSEPPASLFEVPPDFKLQESTGRAAPRKPE